MGSYRILSHTADVGFEASGATLPELFETAAEAMFSIEYDPSHVDPMEQAKVQTEADDVEALLAAWLSDLVFIHDARRFAPGTFRVEKLSAGPEACFVEGVAWGAVMGDWFEQSGPQIKAVTLHGLELRSDERGFHATVFLDV